MALEQGELKDFHLFALFFKKKRLRGDLMTARKYLHGEKRAGIAGSVIWQGGKNTNGWLEARAR